MLFSGIFHERITALIPKFCKKTVHSLKNTLLSGAYFVLNRQFAKRYSALISFFFKLDFKTPIFGVKTSILTRLYYIIDKQNQQDAFFFFRFCKKKQLLSCLYFVKKLYNPLKTVLLCYLLQLFIKKTIVICSYLVKKASMLSKLHPIMV